MIFRHGHKNENTHWTIVLVSSRFIDYSMYPLLAYALCLNMWIRCLSSISSEKRRKRIRILPERFLWHRPAIKECNAEKNNSHIYDGNDAFIVLKLAKLYGNVKAMEWDERCCFNLLFLFTVKNNNFVCVSRWLASSFRQWLPRCEQNKMKTCTGSVRVRVCVGMPEIACEMVSSTIFIFVNYFTYLRGTAFCVHITIYSILLSLFRWQR